MTARPTKWHQWHHIHTHIEYLTTLNPSPLRSTSGSSSDDGPTKWHQWPRRRKHRSEGPDRTSAASWAASVRAKAQAGVLAHRPPTIPEVDESRL